MIVPLDKPGGVTSASCVRRIGRAAGMRAGHAGTLDPGATGLLVVCLGESRKLSRLLVGHDKCYTASLCLGAATDTLDAWGEITETMDVPAIKKQDVLAVARRFTGRIRQRVPAYSAVKQDGKPLYRKARQGVHVTPPEREVVIHSIDVIDVGEAQIELGVSCGPGTYIRSLVRDMARALGTVGHLASLRRLACGHLRVEQAPGLEEVLVAARGGDLTSHVVTHACALDGHHLLVAGEPEAGRLRCGRPVPLDCLHEISTGSPPAVVLDPAGHAVCIARVGDGEVRPRRVLLATTDGTG